MLDLLLADLLPPGWFLQSLGQVGVSGGWLAILAHGFDIHTGTGPGPSAALSAALASSPREQYLRGLEPPARLSLRSLLPPRPLADRRF